MFQIDDKFIDELGLAALPADEKKEFEKYVRKELQERVGEQLTAGMDEDTLDEFGYFMDGNLEGMKSWLERNVPNYKDDRAYQQLAQANPNASEAELLSSYGALAWLQNERPDYPQVVAQVLNGLKAEISANRDAILKGIAEA